MHSTIVGMTRPERIADILKDPSRKVTDIPGIGKGLAFVLAEIAARGSHEKRDQLLERFPPSALEFLKIQGLGPKSIALIFEHYRISTIDELERLCNEQKLRVLPRMGAKLEEKVEERTADLVAANERLSILNQELEQLSFLLQRQCICSRFDFTQGAHNVWKLALLW